MLLSYIDTFHAVIKHYHHVSIERLQYTYYTEFILYHNICPGALNINYT